MANISPKDRRIARLKRERNQAWRELEVIYKTGKELVTTNNALLAELKRYIKKYGELKEPAAQGVNSVADQLTADADYDPTETMIALNQAEVVSGE